MNRVAGTVVEYKQKPTGSRFAHAKNEKLWLDRLKVQKEDGELTTLILDEYSHVEVLGDARRRRRVRGVRRRGVEIRKRAPAVHMLNEDLLMDGCYLWQRNLPLILALPGRAILDAAIFGLIVADIIAAPLELRRPPPPRGVVAGGLDHADHRRERLQHRDRDGQARHARGRRGHGGQGHPGVGRVREVWSWKGWTRRRSLNRSDGADFGDGGGGRAGRGAGVFSHARALRR